MDDGGGSTRRDLVSSLLLVGIVPGRGRLRLGTHTALLLDAAVLADLAAEGRIVVTGTGDRARIEVVDRRPVAQPVAAEALRWLDRCFGPPTAADQAELDATGWLTRRVVTWAAKKQGWWPTLPDALAGFGTRRRVVEQLVATGVLTVRDHSVLGIVRWQQLTPTSPQSSDDLVAQVRAVALGERDADATTGPLLGLLGVADLWDWTGAGAAHLARGVPRARRHEVGERARQLAETGLGSAEVTKLVATTRAVIVEVNRKRAASGD